MFLTNLRLRKDMSMCLKCFNVTVYDDTSEDECFIICDHLNSGERSNIIKCCSFSFCTLSLTVILFVYLIKRETYFNFFLNQHNIENI